MTVLTLPTRLDRWSGGCLMAASPLLLTGILHPDIFETTLADAALGEPLWVPMHAAAVLVAVLTLIGLAGLYAPRAAQLGGLGAVGFAVVVPGLVMTGAVAWAEAFLLPPIALTDAAVFDWSGPVTTSLAVRITTGMALLWLVGLVVLGVALWRSGTLPAGPCFTLAGAAAGFALFSGPLIPVLAPLSTVALAIGYAWVGVSFSTGRTPHSAAAEQPVSRRHTTAGRGWTREKPHPWNWRY